MSEDYTKKENEYASKSWKANLAGGFTGGFGIAGFTKIAKSTNSKIPFTMTVTKTGKTLGLISKALNLSAFYFDAQAIRHSKEKPRAVLNALGRQAGGFGAAFLGAGSASYIRLTGLRKQRAFVNNLKKQGADMAAKVSANPTVAFYKAKPVNEGAKLGNMMKDKANRAVRFIRVRGRIVPIFGGGKVVSVPKKLSAPKG